MKVTRRSAAIAPLALAAVACSPPDSYRDGVLRRRVGIGGKYFGVQTCSGAGPILTCETISTGPWSGRPDLR
jgi:hypothetical protein